MNKKMISLILILAVSSQLFANAKETVVCNDVYKKGHSGGTLSNGVCTNFKENSSETGMPHYQDPPLKYEVTGLVNFYQGMLHTMDETNRKNGKMSHYYTREVDDSDFSDIKVPLYHDRDESSGHKPYFLFSNGTEVNDLTFKKKEDFDKELKKTQSENKELILLKGQYKTYRIAGTFGRTTETCSYGIEGDESEKDAECKDNVKESDFYVSVEDYKKNLAELDSQGNVIGKKSPKEINKFFAEKLKNKGYKIDKDGDLMDEKDYKVFIDIDLVTIQNPAGSKIKKVDREKRDEVYSKRFVYRENPAKRILYSIDGDMTIEDNFNDKQENGKKREMLFLGQGVIKGTLDLGEKNGADKSGSSNEERVAIFRESGIGRYGTNIVMGPSAIFKNIDKISVGGGGDDKFKTGIAPLTIDIDPNVRDSHGVLNKNVLKNSSSVSDKKIEFKKSDGKDDYKLELMASRVSKDEKVDMGNYGDLNYISDSIAHRVISNVQKVENKKSSENNQSHEISIEVKDNIKRLSGDKNEVYKSIKDSGQLGKLHETLTNSNKKTRFVYEDLQLMDKNNRFLAKAIMEAKSAEEVMKELSQFHLTEKEKTEVQSLMTEFGSNSRIKDNLTEIKEIEKISKEEKFKKMLENLKKVEKEFKEKGIDKNTCYEKKEEIQKIMEICKEDIEFLEKCCNGNEKYSRFGSTRSNGSYEQIDLFYMKSALKDLIENCKQEKNCSKKYFQYYVENLQKKIPKFLEYSEKKEETIKRIEEIIKKELTSGSASLDYDKLKHILYYTVREEEALQELKTILSQMQDKNIYSKLNKIANSEITTYTSLPFEIRHSLTGDKKIAKGGFISSRTVQSHLKGNIYTGYGLYEKSIGNGSRAGLLFGGANTNYKETYSRTAKTVSTNSNIKGVSAYVGGYINRPLYEELRWITGAGVQYGRYAVKRDMKNNYQQLSAKGNANVGAFNTYSGLILSYPLQEDVEVQVKGLLSYSFINQGKVHENGDLNLNIQSKNYHYLDSEVGVSLNKTLYDSDRKSNLSAGISAISGLAGYKNKDLSARVSGANSSFHIVGDKIKKDAVKILLDYNVQLDAGMTYGLEGTYITNDDESNVKIGLKAGYTF